MKGFTLLEAVFFLLILAIALPGILGGQRLVLDQAARPAKLVQAQLLAQAKMEMIISDRNLGAGLYSGVTQGVYPPERPIHPTDPLLRNFNRIVTIIEGKLEGSTFSCDPGLPFPQPYRCVTVTVTDAASQDSLAELRTMLANL